MKVINKMVHVATVHYKSDRWINTQLKYLRENVHDKIRVYAFLNKIPKKHHSKFYYSTTESVKASSAMEEHAIKLNRLADVVQASESSSDDLLVFLDGDAFPVSDLISYARPKMQKYPLVAVQRLENAGDVQPHPCFCVTTVDFWKKIGGDWKPGYQWRNNDGEVTDVGGNLLGILEQKEIDWYPMHRSNQKNLHPVWFGIYDNVVYHHGAGFRQPISREDIENKVENDIKVRLLRAARWFSVLGPRYLPGVGRLPGVRLMQNKISEKIDRRKSDLKSKVKEENKKLSKRVFKEVKESEKLKDMFQ
jgi:hypothetical protein